ncbi:NF038122 family metalloprotease [Sphingomonas qilianensis]|uniref:NF038122 family metalloprotease n=1 Tax=Sphingomonas qilianensis TaxID=1736690 RepID=A0ABU9XR27_9SPHN
MHFKGILCCSAAMVTLCLAPANAAVINLVDQGGVTGSAAEQGFNIAAAYWGSILTNSVTINLGVSFAALNPGIIGSTGSRRLDYSVANWENQINATKSNSTLDQNIVLPTLTGGGASFITNGVDEDGNDDTSKLTYIDGDSTSSQVLYLNSSVVKAIGGNLSSPGALDGTVRFSSNFAFDFNPSDGITANTFDFIGVAIHEIGHALGFVSGVDFLDYYGGPDGPGAGALGYSLNDTSIYSALDMFRYSDDPTGIAPGTGATLDLAVGGTKYFSIDGGQTALFGNTMSTGSYNGDGRQASHWKDTAGCQVGNGLLDPTFCFGQEGVVTALDLAAYDAMGWNLSVDALANGGSYLATTGDIYQQFAPAIPEPATWAMMLAGFGMIGGSMRRRKIRTTVSFA